MMSLEEVLQTPLEDVLEDENCYTEDVFKTFQDVLENKKCLLGEK